MHAPTTDVSFAPTEPFAKRYPNEVKAQSGKFVTPTWAANVAPEEEPLFIPTQLEDENPLLEETPRADTASYVAVGIVALLVGAGLIYIGYRTFRE